MHYSIEYEREDIGPKMPSRIAKHTGLTPKIYKTKRKSAG